MSRAHEPHTSACSGCSRAQNGQRIGVTIVSLRRDLQDEHRASSAAIAVLDIDPDRVIAGGKFRVRHIDAGRLDEGLQARRQVNVRTAQIARTPLEYRYRRPSQPAYGCL